MEAGEEALYNSVSEGNVDQLPILLILKSKCDRLLQNGGQSFGPSTNRTGDIIWVQTKIGIDLVLNSVRTQVFHPNVFEQLGIDLNQYRIIVVKSTQHFYAGFKPIASKIFYVMGPGALTSELRIDMHMLSEVNHFGQKLKNHKRFS